MAWLGPAQATTTGGAESLLYVVPAGRQFTASSLSVCNAEEAEEVFFTIRIAPTVSTSAETKQFLYRNQRVFTTFVSTIGITLAAGNAIFVSASDDNTLAFQLFGVEQAV